MVLTTEQTRQFIDVAQVYSGYRLAVRERRISYRYAMRWRMIKGSNYLYCGQRSLGVRNVDTEEKYNDYTERRNVLDERIAATTSRLAEMAPVNRALRLGRVPKLPARVLRALYNEGAFDFGLMVIGTHALFAYEAAAGDFFQSSLLATTDLDLLWDANEQLSMLNEHGTTLSILSVLQRVDRSFDLQNYGLSAANKENFIVEMTAPFDSAFQHATDIAGDMPANPIPETKELLSMPPYSVTAIGEDGLPVQIQVPQPDLYVTHKRAISADSARPAGQRRRDAAQADALEPFVHALKAAMKAYQDQAAAEYFQKGK